MTKKFNRRYRVVKSRTGKLPKPGETIHIAFVESDGKVEVGQSVSCTNGEDYIMGKIIGRTSEVAPEYNRSVSGAKRKNSDGFWSVSFGGENSCDEGGDS